MALMAPLLIDLTSAPSLEMPESLLKRKEKTSLKKDWAARVEEAEKSRKYYLAGRKIRASSMGQKKAAPPPSVPSAELLAKLIGRLQEAEIRRDMELEAVKFKAACSSKPKVAKADSVADHGVKALKLATKQIAATQRRNEIIAAKVAKAASPPRSPDLKAAKTVSFDKAPVAKRLLEAERRRQEVLGLKVAKAQASSSPRKALDAGESAVRAARLVKLAAKQLEACKRREDHLAKKVDKAKLGSPPKAPKAARTPSFDTDAAASSLESKLSAADERRCAVLAAKVAKAAVRVLPPPPPSDLELKLADKHAAAAARRDAHVATKIARAEWRQSVAPPADDDAVAQAKAIIEKQFKAAVRKEMTQREKVYKARTLGTDDVLQKELVRTVRDAHKMKAAQVKLAAKLNEAKTRRDDIIAAKVAKAQARAVEVSAANFRKTQTLYTIVAANRGPEVEA